MPIAKTESEILDCTLWEIGARIKNREVSPVEVTEAAMERAERLQPVLFSFITLLHESARRQAKDAERALLRGHYQGPLHGVPIGIKDNIATAGIRSTAGSKVLANLVPDEDAHAVRRIKEAGAVILGKENLHEFAAGATLTPGNPFYGTMRNPWSLEHSVGGSSGGSGVNVATRITFASLGTDRGGSGRIPPALCGVVALKQTFGRVSQRGMLVTTYHGDHIVAVTRSAKDSAIMLQTMAGCDPLDPSTVPVPVPDYLATLDKNLIGLRMGIPSNHFFDSLDPEVDGAVQKAIAALEGMGVKSQEVSLPSMRHSGVMMIAHLTDAFVAHEPYLATQRQDYTRGLLYRLLAGQFVLARDYSKALKLERLIKEEFARALQKVDFLVTPTTPAPAALIDGPAFGRGNPYTVGFARNTMAANYTGLPAITVPCGLTDAGLPIGLHFIGRPFDEALLLRVAHRYEGVSPSRGRKPPLLD